MKEEFVKKRIGQKVRLILKNGFEYTTIIPEFEGSAFTFIDKYGNSIDVECSIIEFIMEVGDRE